MIKYTERLDRALKKAAWAHEQAGQHRKGTEIPYIIHPVGVMMIASNATDDEDILIACLMHDVIEDVDSSIYSKDDMRADFGDRVVSIVLDVTKDSQAKDWYDQSNSYLQHLEHKASEEAIIVSASDKIHNLQSILVDFENCGDDIWQIFNTKNSCDQLWWYKEVLKVVKKRSPDLMLIKDFEKLVSNLSNIIAT
jgi:(p)ppGpp synthase/HD superfamily hydrolase